MLDLRPASVPRDSDEAAASVAEIGGLGTRGLVHLEVAEEDTRSARIGIADGTERTARGYVHAAFLGIVDFKRCVVHA